MMSAVGEDALAPLRALLAAMRRKSADLAEHLHPLWLAKALAQAGLDGLAPARPALPRLLGSLYRLRWPDPAAFAALAHRVVLLPRADIQRALAAMALWSRRDRVRLCIGHHQRATLIALLGEPAYACMLEAPPLRRSGAGPLTAAELEAGHLFHQGARQLTAGSSGWRDPDLLSWLYLALPPQTASHLQAPPAEREDGGLVLHRLGMLFPEYAWLFGTSMTRCLSASTTA